MDIGEIWKDVVDFEGIYEVSSHGRVRSSKDKTTQSTLHGTRKWRQRILRQKISKDNNCRVSLWKNKTNFTWLVHRLVAFAFIPTIDGKDYINHKDGNRLNNFAENLEWCDHEENSNHAFNSGLMPSNKFIILENLITGELTRFVSLSDASEFLGRNHNYVMNCIERNQFIVDHYCIYFTMMENKERISFL